MSKDEKQKERNEFWNPKSWCQLKHLLKCEVNLKESIEKAKRGGSRFEPTGGELRNYLNAVGNIEAAVGHYEEFASRKEGEEKEFYSDMMDDARYLRQEMVAAVGKDVGRLSDFLSKLSDLIEKQTEFMVKEEE